MSRERFAEVAKVRCTKEYMLEDDAGGAELEIRCRQSASDFVRRAPTQMRARIERSEGTQGLSRNRHSPVLQGTQLRQHRSLTNARRAIEHD